MPHYAFLVATVLTFVYTLVKWDLLPRPGRIVLIALICGMLAAAIHFYPSK